MSIVTIELEHDGMPAVTLEVVGHWVPPEPGVARTLGDPGEPSCAGFFEWHSIGAEGNPRWLPTAGSLPKDLLDTLDDLIQTLALEQFGGEP